MSSVPPPGSRTRAAPASAAVPRPRTRLRPPEGLPWESQAIGPEPFFETAKLFITAPVQAWRLTRETGDFMRRFFSACSRMGGLVFSAFWGTVFGAGLMR